MHFCWLLEEYILRNWTKVCNKNFFQANASHAIMVELESLLILEAYFCCFGLGLLGLAPKSLLSFQKVPLLKSLWANALFKIFFHFTTSKLFFFCTLTKFYWKNFEIGIFKFVWALFWKSYQRHIFSLLNGVCFILTLFLKISFFSQCFTHHHSCFKSE